MITSLFYLNVLSLLLPSSVTAGVQGSGNAHDYPLQSGLDYKLAGNITVLAVVECTGPGAISERTYSTLSAVPEPYDPVVQRTRSHIAKDKALVESVRVIDSTSLPPGATVKVVTPIGHDHPAFEMRQGNRYLLLASAAKDGRLEIPTARESVATRATPALSANEISGWAVFETKATSLPKGDDLADRIVNSIADTLSSASDEGVRRATGWFESCGYPGGGRGTDQFGRADFPVSLRLRSLAEHASSDYQRARIYRVLCAWHVAGAEGPFVQALIASSKNPSAFTSTGDYLLGGILQYSVAYSMSHPNYKAFALDGNVWADAVLNAKSLTIQRFLLMNLGGHTDEAHDKALANMMVRSEEGLGRVVARHLAWNQNRPDLQPTEELVGGKSVWTNRQMVTRAWASRYGVGTP